MTSRPLAVALATFAGLTLSCGGSKSTESTQEKAPASEGAAAGGTAWKPTGNEGSATGKVAFEGTAPKPRPLSMDADSVCAAKHTTPVYPETLVVNSNGTLRNVFVYVKSGLEGKTFTTPDTPVELDQDGCVYKPHVLGIQTGQNLKVVTSDKTTHNIHPMPKVNREWNVSQPPGADAIIKTFSRPEESIPVKCNQHPWMKAFIHVTDNPFFAVTGDDGSFELKGLPPGKYELVAMHEQLGTTTQPAVVEANKPTTVSFTFKAGQAYQPSSFKTMPALVIHSCCGKAE